MSLTDSPTGVIGLQGDPGPSALLASGIENVPVDSESFTVGGFNALNTNYLYVAVPNWPTAVFEIAVTPTDFTLGFIVPAPAGAFLRWAVFVS